MKSNIICSENKSEEFNKNYETLEMILNQIEIGMILSAIKTFHISLK